MTGGEVGAKLRELRLARGLRQVDLAQAVAGIDAVVISHWENGEQLRRFVRHAPELLELLGPEVWDLVYATSALLHRRDDWEGVGPVAKAFTELLRAKTQRVPGIQPPVTWRFDYPTLEEISVRLGGPQELSVMEQLHLSDLIFCTDLTRGWASPGPPADAQAGTRAHRRRSGRLGPPEV
jgi:transcriptional regulator with XRE-family HTH domain